MPPLYPFLSPVLAAAGFRHGFFGRVGGLSQGPYTSLNCSYSVGDDPQHVAGNLGRIARHLGLAPDQLRTISQVHGSTVVDCEDVLALADIHRIPADAIVSSTEGQAVCIRTADCVPVLVGCRATGVVAAIHAGWRGLVGEVIPRAIETLIRKGARVDAMVAAVGPHILLDAFEVSEEVAVALDSVAPSAHAVVRRPPARPHVQLGALAVAQLQRMGLAREQVDALDICTYSRSEDLFSYRRDGKESGRQLSAILPLPTRQTTGQPNNKEN